MNRSALNLKSPLERGGPLALGSVLFEMPLTSFFAFFVLSFRSGLVRDLGLKRRPWLGVAGSGFLSAREPG